MNVYMMTAEEKKALQEAEAEHKIPLSQRKEVFTEFYKLSYIQEGKSKRIVLKGDRKSVV